MIRERNFSSNITGKTVPSDGEDQNLVLLIGS